MKHVGNGLIWLSNENTDASKDDPCLFLYLSAIYWHSSNCSTQNVHVHVYNIHTCKSRMLVVFEIHWKTLNVFKVYRIYNIITKLAYNTKRLSVCHWLIVVGMLYCLFEEFFEGALNDLFGKMFILVAALPCLQLFQNRTKIFFQNGYFTLGLYLIIDKILVLTR